MARLLTDYHFDPSRGLWKHRAGPIEPPLRFTQVGYDHSGTMTFPCTDDRAPASAYSDALAAARELFENAPDADPGTASVASALGDHFEHLRWFELPAECLD